MKNNSVSHCFFRGPVIKLLQVVLPAALLLAGGAARGAHPLITEDTGTQGAGKTQIELVSEYGRERDGARENTTEVAIVVTRGITETLDLALALPWQKARVDDGSGWASERGIGDAELAAKWRFYEQDKLTLALRPAISIPSGDEDRGLGSGRTGGALSFIASYEADPWAWHFYTGWRYNRNVHGERDGIWHVSTAVTRAVGPLKLLADIGIERNAAPDADQHPAFLIVGAIWSLQDNLELDIGYKVGLNDAETDRTLLAGITWRF